MHLNTESSRKPASRRGHVQGVPPATADLICNVRGIAKGAALGLAANLATCSAKLLGGSRSGRSHLVRHQRCEFAPHLEIRGRPPNGSENADAPVQWPLLSTRCTR